MEIIMSPLAFPNSAPLSHDQGLGTFHTSADTHRSVARHHDAHLPKAANDCAHADLSPDAKELAREIDRYKFRHRRRFINYEEILALVKELGYQKDSA